MQPNDNHTSWVKSSWNYVNFFPEPPWNSLNLDLGKMREPFNSFLAQVRESQGNAVPKRQGRSMNCAKKTGWKPCCTYFFVCKFLLFQFFCLKNCLLCMLQFHISHVNIKGSAFVWIVRTTYSNNFPCKFWCSIALFDFPKFFWLFRIMFTFNMVERLFMIPETTFKFCFTWAKATFLFISSNVTANVGFINYVFHLTTIW